LTHLNSTMPEQDAASQTEGRAFLHDLKSLALEGLYVAATLLVLSGIEMLLHSLTLSVSFRQKFEVFHEFTAIGAYVIFAIRSLLTMAISAWKKISAVSK